MLALICARGGSKGIPRKNLQKVGPKTLVEWSLWAAEQINDVSHIAISTDDDEIGASTIGSPAILIKRPAELATDGAPEWLAWRHALKYLEEKHAYRPSELISLPPTSPLRSLDTVHSAINLYKKLDDVSTVVVYTDCSRHPEFNLLTSEDGKVPKLRLWSQPSSAIYNRQQSSNAYDLTTVCFVTSPSNVFKHLSPLQGNVYGVWSPRANAIDIDSPLDLQIARSVYHGKYI